MTTVRSRTRGTGKADRAAAKAEQKADKKAQKDAVKKARNALGVAKVVAPVVIPAVAPFAVHAAGAAREAYDRYQARKFGVAVDRLHEFTGRGAALHARIAGVSDGLSELRAAERATADDREFAVDGLATLEQLAASVRAAERMPTARRKAAHRAVGAELDTLENNLLHRLGL
ncbi:hypothetical protein SAMN05216266_101687 [Amycolatopsis marina]|uniref:Uncharacterized protein n=1 Tax=Amycolatopsis marina TaxID=490629 RepID=A0A1I0W3C7_9PSEU|nr:hypothetical protein SAMN05216266_101687 [Amycolatopsis marina]